MYNINKKDLNRINQEIGEKGELQNESSLDFALTIQKSKKPWLIEMSFLLRSLLVDHAFQDGNKRTALAVTLTYFADKNLDFNKDDLCLEIYKIAKNNITDMNKIARGIQNVIR